MFKEKNSKKRLPLVESSKGSTLDARHQRMLDGFETKIQEWNSVHSNLHCRTVERRQWEERIQELASQRANAEDEALFEMEYQAAWTSNLRLTDETIQLQARLRELECRQQEIQYFEHTGKILFDYYDLLEKQTTDIPPELSPVPSTGKTTRSILEVFQSYYQQSEPPSDAPSAATATATSSGSCTGPASAPDATTVDKRTLVEQYMSVIDPSFIRPHYQEIHPGECPHCAIPLTYLIQDGLS